MRRVVIALLPLLLLGAGPQTGGWGGGGNPPSKRNDTSLLRFLPAIPNLSQQCTGATLLGTRGEAMGFSRTSSAVCEKADGTMVLLSSGQPRLQKNGVFLEPAATNSIINNDAIPTSSGSGWTLNTVTVTTDVKSYGLGVTMDQINNTGAVGDSVSQGVTVTSTAGPFVLSSYVAAVSGSATPGIMLRCSGPPVSCTCGTSNGQSCNTNTGGGNDCNASTTVGTTPVRLWGIATCPSAITNPLVILIPNGAYPGGSPANAQYGGMQLEAGSTLGQPTSVIPTGGTAVTRMQDLLLPTRPAAMTETKGCMKICYAPSWSGNAPGSSLRILSYGDGSASARFGAAIQGTSTVGAADGVTTTAVTTTFNKGVRSCYLTEWDASQNFIRVTNMANSVSASNTFTTFPAFLGSLVSGGSLASQGEISDWAVGSGPGMCR